MLAQRLLDQHRRHVPASAPDAVALAVDEVEPAVLVDEAEVAGQEPAVPQGGRRRLGVAEVRRQAGGRADRNLARPARRERAAFVVEDAEFDAGDRRGPPARGPGGAQGRGGGHARHRRAPTIRPPWPPPAAAEPVRGWGPRPGPAGAPPARL